MFCPEKNSKYAKIEQATIKIEACSIKYLCDRIKEQIKICFMERKDTLAINRALEGLFPEEEMRENAADILKRYLLKRIGKKEMEELLKEKSVDIKRYNKFILSIISSGCTVQKKSDTVIDYDKIIERETLHIKNILSERFLQEINRCLENTEYVSKSIPQYSFFRRTSEDLSAAVNERPQLISLFSASYNVLCSKINKIVSIKEIQNKLKKNAFEYKLDENIEISLAKAMYECLIFYIKTVIEKALNRDTGVIDKDILYSMMFGNIKGIYFLYEDYPPMK